MPDADTVGEGRYGEFGLHVYYREERLAGIAVDALCGPQVSADGAALADRVPSVVERWILDRAESRGPEVSYLSAGVPCSESPGQPIPGRSAGAGHWPRR
ncbi:hypothetical protein ACIA8F_23990 [Streptomyces sp. NPDC051563]|uniref:hypothetical protein n=1 Tax=Streptomyces sp. NPDC051563 TaxID=3365659 RepID=UPI0037B88F12